MPASGTASGWEIIMDGKQIGLKLRNGLSVVFLVALGGVGMNNLYDHLTKDEDKPPAPPPATQPAAVPVQPPPTVISIPAPANDGLALAPGAYAARRITPGEVQLAAKLFGTALDVSQLKFQFFKEPADNRVSDIPPGSTDTINIYGKDIAARDYSREGADNFGTFVYEMTQLWQNQSGGKFTRGTPDASGYELDSRYSFQSYGRMQQSQIMEDYARRFLHPDRASLWLNEAYGDRMDTDPYLQRLVERQFPAAKQARLDFANVEIRVMTPAETALIKGIFAGQIDTTQIKLYLHPEKYDDAVGSVASSRAADFWGSDNHSGDYTKGNNAENFGTFVHELTHVWQNQTNDRFTSSYVPEGNKYLYPLEAKYKFTDYGVEQQAAMVEDYARRFLHPSKSFTWLGQVYGDPESKAAMLMKMVETQFPAARQLRLNYERSRSYGGTPVASYRPAAIPAYG